MPEAGPASLPPRPQRGPRREGDAQVSSVCPTLPPATPHPRLGPSRLVCMGYISGSLGPRFQSDPSMGQE